MEKKLSFTNSLTFQMEITSRIFYNMAKNQFNENVRGKITLEEYIVIDMLVCYPHLNGAGIANSLIIDRNSIEKILSKLIRKKFVKEVTKKTNEIQVKYYELTKAGEKVYYDNMLPADKMVEILARFISENELVTFTKTLLKIRNILISLGYVI